MVGLCYLCTFYAASFLEYWNINNINALLLRYFMELIYIWYNAWPCHASEHYWLWLGCNEFCSFRVRPWIFCQTWNIVRSLTMLILCLPRLLTQPFIQTQIKENIKAPRHWPLCGEFTGDRWILGTNGQWRGKCFHLMTSSWCFKYVRIFYVILVVLLTLVIIILVDNVSVGLLLFALQGHLCSVALLDKLSRSQIWRMLHTYILTRQSVVDSS